MVHSALKTGHGRKRRAIVDHVLHQKKIKVQQDLDSLPWKSIVRPLESGLTGDDGILELEEVDDVEVVYEKTVGGRVVKFNLLQTLDNEIKVDKPNEKSIPESNAVDESYEEFNSQNLLPSWHQYELHSQLYRFLFDKGFVSPTPIQAAAIPYALEGRDVIGIAETGSGKTLAYGLPMLHHLLSLARLHPPTKSNRTLRGLILAPTRELALQVSSQLNACLNLVNSQSPVEQDGLDASSEITVQPLKKRRVPLVSIAAIVGGMSAQKQRRILDRGVDILVATPGRLWDIIQDDIALSRSIRHIKFLVLDEADRMIESGHFAELDNIFRLTIRTNKNEQIESDLPDGFEDLLTEDNRESTNDGMQTFIFSATLSKDLQRNLKKRPKFKSSKKHQQSAPATTLDDLLLRLDFRDPEPEVLDLSPEGGIVSTLKEGKIQCLSTDKDVYLYYFLLRYPGRSLVFLSSIDGIRRLMPLLDLLEIRAFPLHSQLEQRQRLKNLDGFKSTQNAVLLATDIAARGLDIPAVDHVIHYQIPRTTDTYVHRNGRTARAKRSGFSLLMCAPDERKVVKALLGNLGREENDIPEMDLELNLLDKLKHRIQLARQIETAHHKIKKENHERRWMKAAADALEIELDSDFMSDSNHEAQFQNLTPKARNAKNAAMKAELKCLLAEPLIVRGVSTKYITSGSRPIVDDLLAGHSNDALLGLKKADAASDLSIKKPGRKRPRRAEKADYEEWHGIANNP